MGILQEKWLHIIDTTTEVSWLCSYECCVWLQPLRSSLLLPVPMSSALVADGPPQLGFLPSAAPFGTASSGSLELPALECSFFLSVPWMCTTSLHTSFLSDSGFAQIVSLTWDLQPAELMELHER